MEEESALPSSSSDYHYEKSAKQKIFQDLQELARDVKDLAVESVLKVKEAAVDNVDYVGHQTSKLRIHAVDQFKEILHNNFLRKVVTSSSRSWHILTQDDRLWIGGAFGVTVISLLVWFSRRKMTTKPRSRSTFGSITMEEPSNREISGRDRKASTDESFQSKRNNAINMLALGPNVASITYETWAPPTPWREAAKHLLPANIKTKPQSKITLDIRKGTLLVNHINAVTYDISKITLDIQRPIESGVVELLVADHDQKLEHTFQSAYEAAQFQHDVIGYQVVGTQLIHIYHALELAHKGSMAHVGMEPVLHDTAGDAEFQVGAVAWDDVMRCLGGTAVRSTLEQIRMLQDVKGNYTILPTLHPDYRKTRAFIGHVDFFRLFVSVLPETALPHVDSHPTRLEYWLRLRKQVAEAAVLVRSYVVAMQVVNQGWNPWPDQTMLRRRMAFDKNVDNLNRDRSSQSEYYEATVSRDVRCDIHTPQHLITMGASQQSAYQAFSLVSCQAFQLPKDGRPHHFSHAVDPVEALPSLKQLISHHPGLDFFVSVFFPEGPRVAIVKLFVRSLPKGVDPGFDANWQRFKTSDKVVRDRKLALFVQLGPGSLSPVAWAALKVASLFLRWTRRDEPAVPSESGNERTPFPGMIMRNYMKTAHFGGALQTNPALPGNYVAVTSRVDSSTMNMVFRALYQKLEAGALPSSTIDFTYVLEGEQKDQLPERALGTIRIVRMSPVSCALPIECSAKQAEPTAREARIMRSITPLRKSETSTSQAVEFSLDVQARNNTVVSPVNRAINMTYNSLRSIFSFEDVSNEEAKDEVEELSVGEHFQNNLDKDDPFKDGVDALADILVDIQVPVRRASLAMEEIALVTPIPVDGRPELALLTKQDNWCNIAINKRMTKSDLKRFYLAAECDIKIAAVRVVESIAWRGKMFPIDTRECRIELQIGQFFQQGKDYFGNPVFYFQTMCLGPWRKNEEAVIRAVLHRLETSIQHYSTKKPDVQCTVVIVLGKPIFRTQTTKNTAKSKKGVGDDVSTKRTDVASLDPLDGNGEDDETNQTVATEREFDPSAWDPYRLGVNPRLSSGEDYYAHATTKMIARLIDTLSKHYPERLHKALCVPGKGGYAYRPNIPNAFALMMQLSKYIPSARTRAKVIFLRRVGELKEYISPEEMVTLVGGRSLVHSNAFEC